MVDHDGPVARLRVENSSDQLLELVVEPEGNDHWLLPGETFVVTTVGSRDADPWAGNTIDHEPFEVQYYSRSVTVHADGRWGYVSDVAGNEIECGHRRPSAWRRLSLQTRDTIKQRRP